MAVCQEGEPRIELGSSPSLGAGDGRPYRQVLESKDRVPEREDISRERERDLQRSAQDPLWFSAEHPSTHASVKTSWVSWKKKKNYSNDQGEQVSGSQYRETEPVPTSMGGKWHDFQGPVKEARQSEANVCIH